MTNSLKVAVCASLVLGSVFSGNANENAGTYLNQARELAGKAGDSLKQAGNVVLGKGADVSGWAKEKASGAYTVASEKASGVYSIASDKLSDAYKATSGKTADIYQSASDKASDAYSVVSDKAAVAYQAASEKAVLAFNWAENKTPEGVKAFLANHPYITLTAVVAPIALLIGYKIGKRKPVKRD